MWLLPLPSHDIGYYGWTVAEYKWGAHKERMNLDISIKETVFSYCCYLFLVVLMLKSRRTSSVLTLGNNKEIPVGISTMHH